MREDTVQERRPGTRRPGGPKDCLINGGGYGGVGGAEAGRREGQPLGERGLGPRKG